MFYIHVLNKRESGFFQVRSESGKYPNEDNQTDKINNRLYSGWSVMKVKVLYPTNDESTSYRSDVIFLYLIFRRQSCKKTV